MEYSKEDLMEAKKQIWGVGENMGTEESKKIWEENARKTERLYRSALVHRRRFFRRELLPTRKEYNISTTH